MMLTCIKIRMRGSLYNTDAYDLNEVLSGGMLQGKNSVSETLATIVTGLFEG